MPATPLPRRLLLGPGPSNVHPRVLCAMAQPLLGHLDPAFLRILDEVQAGLRDLFGTASPMTLPLCEGCAREYANAPYGFEVEA